MKSTFKLLDSTNCTLKNTQIDIWQYPLHTIFTDAVTLLSEDERTRANRFYFARHQRCFTVARAMLRVILGRYLKIPPHELLFTYNQHGKPALLNDPSLQFNLSHSGEYALLAVGKDRPVGIDLEFFSARPYEGIGKHLFSPLENQSLTQLDSRLKPLAFFHIWAQKEAFIKACGLGLAYPTEQFDVPILPNTHQEIIDPLYEKTWKITSFMPEAACCAAVCYHPLVKDIHYLKCNDLNPLIDQADHDKI